MRPRKMTILRSETSGGDLHVTCAGLSKDRKLCDNSTPQEGEEIYSSEAEANNAGWRKLVFTLLPPGPMTIWLCPNCAKKIASISTTSVGHGDEITLL